MHTHAHTHPATVDPEKAAREAEIAALQDEARDVAVADGPAAAVGLFEGRLPRSKSWIKRHIGLLLTDLDLLIRVVQHADPTGETASRRADRAREKAAGLQDDRTSEEAA